MFLSHEWSVPLGIRLAYETTVYQSYYRAEQRRALRTKPLLEVRKNLVFEATDAQKFLASIAEEVYIPIDQEYIYGTRGFLKVTTTTDLSYYYFLKNLDNVYLIDEDENLAKVASVVGSTINLVTNISGTSKHMYTAIKAYYKNASIQYETDGLISLGVTFLQIRSRV